MYLPVSKMKQVNNLFLITGICLLLNIHIIWGQGVQFDHYGVADGISQSEILCIFQDSEGYMWFGTQNGLNKFDGYSFEKYFNNPSDTSTISNSWIFDITEDDNGIIWIGTKGGLNKFDKNTGLFTYHSLSDSIAEDNFNFIY